MLEAELIPVSDIVIGRRVRQDPLAHLAQLSESIRRLGLLHPILVNSRNELVAGFRRLQAVKKLGWASIPVRRLATLDDAVWALTAERDENTCRNDMTLAELVEIGRQIEELEKPAARGRQKAGGTAGGKASGKLPEASAGDTRDKVAAALEISGKTYEKAKQVIEAAEAEPEKFGDLKEQLERPGAKVDPVHKELKSRKARPADRREIRSRLADALARLKADPALAAIAQAVQRAIDMLDATTEAA